MFKPNSDAIQIGTDQIKIPCRNGLRFTEDETVIFDIPRSVGFCDLANAYIEADVKITNPNSSAAQESITPMMSFDKVTGVNSSINEVTIRSEGRLIEQLQNYNVYAQAHYNATEDEGNVNKRTRLEGVAKSYNVLDNPFVVPTGAVTSNTLVNANADCWQYVERKVALPILGGVFTNPRSHPAMFVPLSVHVLLEKAARCLRLTHAGGVPAVRTAAPVAGAAGAKTGEHITMVNSTGQANGAVAAGLTTIYVSNRSRFSSIPGTTAGGDMIALAEGEQYLNPLVNFPYRVGQTIRCEAWDGVAAAAVLVDTTITSLRQMPNGGAEQNKIEIIIGAQFSANAVSNATIQPITDTGGFIDAATQGAMGYSWSNPRLVIPKVVPPPQVVQAISGQIAKGMYSMDLQSWSLYKNAITANQNTSTNIIPADLSRCKSIISIPLNQENLDNVLNSNALCGQYLQAENYQYSINNRLVPDRRVDLRRERFPELAQHSADEPQAPYQLGQYVSGFHVHETEKALRNANINVRNLASITLNNASILAANGNLGQSSNRSGSWLVARSLGAGVGTSENLIGKSVILYLNYQTGTSGAGDSLASQQVKLLHNYVSHIRTLTVGMAGVEVYY